MSSVSLLQDALSAAPQARVRRTLAKAGESADFRLDRLVATGSAEMLRASTALSRLAFTAHLLIGDAGPSIDDARSTAFDRALRAYQASDGRAATVLGRMEPLDLAV
ncbi:MAG: hypothetical protein ACFB6S_08685 [Geminicoccaceae bacterium]